MGQHVSMRMIPDTDFLLQALEDDENSDKAR